MYFVSHFQMLDPLKLLTIFPNENYIEDNQPHLYLQKKFAKYKIGKMSLIGWKCPFTLLCLTCHLINLFLSESGQH